MCLDWLDEATHDRCRGSSFSASDDVGPTGLAQYWGFLTGVRVDTMRTNPLHTS